MIEWVHRNLKASLRAKCTSSTWTSNLPLILLGLQSAPREADSICSFERTFGVPPILPRDFWSSAETPNYEFLPEFQLALGTYTPPSSSPNRSVSPSVPPDLSSCRFVFIRVDGSGRPPLSPLYSGPFLVLEPYRSSFKLQVGTHQEVVNISRLKPAYTSEDAEPAQPPKRGPRKKLRPPEVPQPAVKAEVMVVLLHPHWASSFIRTSSSYSCLGPP